MTQPKTPEKLRRFHSLRATGLMIALAVGGFWRDETDWTKPRPLSPSRVRLDGITVFPRTNHVDFGYIWHREKGQKFVEFLEKGMTIGYPICRL
jgi:hypothetical protein